MEGHVFYQGAVAGTSEINKAYALMSMEVNCSPGQEFVFSHQVLLSRASEDYPRTNPPPLRFIRSCSSSLAAATLHKLEDTFGVPVLEVLHRSSVASYPCLCPSFCRLHPSKTASVRHCCGVVLALSLEYVKWLLLCGKTLLLTIVRCNEGLLSLPRK